MRKILSVILAFLLVAGLSPVMPAKADTTVFAFTLQPADGTADFSGSYTFTWALNSAPDSIELESWSTSGTGWGSIKPLTCAEGTMSDSVSYVSWYDIASRSTYRIRATKGSDTIYSDVFEVKWTGNEPSEHYNTLDCIEITTAPDTTAYTAGQKFDPAGMVITAKYFNASDAVVTNYTISPSGGLTTTDTSVTISYTEGNITKTATQAITVSAAATKTLSSIAITTAPATTKYTAGQNFDPLGMVVTATYSDNSTAEVSSYTVSPSGALATTDTYVTISYTEDNITKTAIQKVTVITGNPLSSIAITTEPDWTTYTAGQNFNPAGMVVTATYADNSIAEVSGYTISPSGALKTTDTSVTITYTENGVTKTATQAITVSAAATKTLSSIAITTAPTTIVYTAGQSFDPAGMVVTATYSDNSTAEVAAYTYSPSGALATTDKNVTISYTEDGVTRTATQAITVIPAGTAGFGFTLQPADGTADFSGSCTFTWALNSAPDSIELESWSTSGTGWGSIKPLTYAEGTMSDSVSYVSWYDIASRSTYRIRATKGSDTIYSDVFEVKWTGNEPSEHYNTLDCIEITTAPDTTAYTAGQKFDPAGMVITAKYFNASDAVVTNYTISPSGGLATTDTSVTISYTEGNITKTVTQAITVNPASSASCTVTFDTNGHGTAPAAQTVESGKTATKPSDPTASGWIFGGWYTEATCTNAFDFSKAIAADFTLYAKWTENKASEETTYIVTVGANGSVTQGSDMTITVKRSVDDNTCFSHFTGVQIDGKACAAGDYDAKAGSTIVTLKAATIQALSVGTHTISIIFDDGKVETKLTVEKATSTNNSGTNQGPNAGNSNTDDSPTTGDTLTDNLYILLILSALCLCGTLVIRRKRRDLEA